jgi:hypothetical protein
VIASAFWLAGVTYYKAATAQPFKEIQLDDSIFRSACHTVESAVQALTTCEPWHRDRITGLLVGAESVRRSGPVPDKWLRLITNLYGAGWPERYIPAGRITVSQRWPKIELLAAEILFQRVVSVGRVYQLVGVKLAA